jgi:hypothetical protein
MCTGLFIRERISHIRSTAPALATGEAIYAKMVVKQPGLDLDYVMSELDLTVRVDLLILMPVVDDDDDDDDEDEEEEEEEEEDLRRLLHTRECTAACYDFDANACCA